MIIAGSFEKIKGPIWSHWEGHSVLLNTWSCLWPHVFTMCPCYKPCVKMSKRCQVVKKSNIWTMEEVHMLMSVVTSLMIVTKNTQNVHRKYFWPILMNFICDIKIDVNICEPHCFNLLFVLWISCIVQMFAFWYLTSSWQLDIFLTSFLTFYSNHLSLAPGYFWHIDPALQYAC